MKHKYRETLIAIILLAALAVIVIGGLIGYFTYTDYIYDLPVDSVWYCEELDTSIDFSGSPHTITFSCSGGKEAHEVMFDYAHIIWYRTENSTGKNSTVVYGSWNGMDLFNKEVFYIRLKGEDKVHAFSLVLSTKQ